MHVRMQKIRWILLFNEICHGQSQLLLRNYVSQHVRAGQSAAILQHSTVFCARNTFHYENTSLLLTSHTRSAFVVDGIFLFALHRPI